VAVNISALFLASLERADEILELLRREGFDPRRLTLEITETEAARNPPVARALLSKLRIDVVRQLMHITLNIEQPPELPVQAIRPARISEASIERPSFSIAALANATFSSRTPEIKKFCQTVSRMSPSPRSCATVMRYRWPASTRTR